MHDAGKTRTKQGFRMEKIPILEAISQPRRAIIPLPLQASGTLSIIVRHGIPAVIRPRRVISSENDKKIVRKEGRKEEKKQRAKRKGEEKLTGSVDRHTLFFAKKKKKIIFSNAFRNTPLRPPCRSRRVKKLNTAERNDRNFEISHRRQPRFPIQQVFKIQLSIYRSSSQRITRRRRREPLTRQLVSERNFSFLQRRR